MTSDELRTTCLGLADAIEEFPFGAASPSVFKVGGKIFAISPLAAAPLTVSVKCDPLLAQDLRASYEGIVPGYHLNKRHWITVTIGADVPDAMVVDLIEDSYALVAAALPRAGTARHPPPSRERPAAGHAKRAG